VSSSSRRSGQSSKEGRTTKLKFFIACALIAAMSETAVAQIPDEKCQKLIITKYTSEQNNANPKHPYLYAVIRNDDPYNVTIATFYIDFLIENDFKVGEGTATIGRLMSGNTESVPVNYRVDQGQDIIGVTLTFTNVKLLVLLLLDVRVSEEPIAYICCLSI
jgi:hypothetical protein